jgi:dihydrofolate reductase
MATKTSYYVASSVDGFIADSEGGGDWLNPFMVTGEDYGYAEFFASVDAMIMGRGTFEKAKSFGDWPYRDTPCWVMSSGDLVARPPSVRVSHDPPENLLADLQARGHRHAWLVGGAVLASEFVRLGLITDVIISYIPVILGGGIPLLSVPNPGQMLRLLDLHRWANGVVSVHYETAGT